MTAGLAGLREKIVEWAVMGALVGVIGYLIGNSDATTMQGQINELKKDNARIERDYVALSARVAVLEPRVERLVTLSELERERMKGDGK